MKKYTIAFMTSILLLSGCDESDSASDCGNGIVDSGEECDGSNFGQYTSSCKSLYDFMTGSLSCNASCHIVTDNCKMAECNHNGIKDANEECDGTDFGTQTCASITPDTPYGRLGCTNDCTIVSQFCGKADLGLQAPNPDSEQTDLLCSDNINNFNNRDERTGKSFIDCDSHACLTSPLVQICHATENSDATCSDRIDNATASNLPKGMNNQTNGLIDCADPSCFKNWRVTVCEANTPRWELGTDCGDGIDNDGDGLQDCNDPDCLHAGISDCQLSGKARVLFDNAHHQIAGAVDWIIDITGRHPYPSKPVAETQWHGSLSSLGKDLIDSNQFVVETLPQDRRFSYNGNSPQKLNDYQIMVSVEPSSKYTSEEISAIHDFVKNGGSLLLFANHKTADRDANQVDAVTAINELLSNLPGASSKENNPFGFYVLDNSSMNNGEATVIAGSESHPVISGPAGTVTKAGYYGGTGFVITDNTKAKSLMKTDSGMDYVIAVEYDQGRIVAIGDSAITGDGTNFLALNSGKNAYADSTLNNKTLILNAFYWLKKN